MSVRAAGDDDVVPFDVLALSGSLRRASANTAALRAAATLAPPALRVRLWDRVGELPPFAPKGTWE